MSVPPEAQDTEDEPRLPWYVYDRYANLLRIADTLADAETWAIAHWEVAEVGDREEVADNDYWYFLLATKPDKDHYHSHDFQARIVRHDRVIALGRDSQATPRYPD